MNFEFMTIDTPLPPCMPFPRALTGFPVSSTAKVMYCRMLDEMCIRDRNCTQAQIDRANAVSLEDFLRTQGETLIKSGREYRWKEHDSLTVRGNKWFRHSQSKEMCIRDRAVYRPHRRSRFTSILLGDSFHRRLEKRSLPRRN